jgi:hypothetical protein
MRICTLALITELILVGDEIYGTVSLDALQLE